MRYKISGAIAVPKASWGCVPALPNRIRVVFLGAMFRMKQCKNGSQRKRFSTSGKRGFHPYFCLPACCNCPVALLEFTVLILMIQLCLNLKALKSAIAAGKTDCKIQFASQMWAARPHLGSIFEKLLHRKTFYLPAARSCKNYGVLYDFHTVFIDTHQQECYNIDVHRKNEFR